MLTHLCVTILIFLGRRYAASQYFWVQNFQGIHILSLNLTLHTQTPVYKNSKSPWYRSQGRTENILVLECLEVDVLSSQRPFKVSLRVPASPQDQLQSWHCYDNLWIIDLNGLPNRAANCNFYVYQQVTEDVNMYEIGQEVPPESLYLVIFL